jgi:hypothetical protein
LSDKNQLFFDFEKSFTQSELAQISSSVVYSTVKKFLILAKIQKEILKNKSSFLRKEEQRQNAIDSLFGNTLHYTLSFVLKYNKEINENDTYSIENFKKQFDLGAKEFSIIYIKAMAEAGMWTHLEKFINQRGLFNMMQKITVPYETIVYIICKTKGGSPQPTEQIKKYLSLIDDIEQRKTLALKLKLTDVVIEAFKVQKDRVGLCNYRNQFREDSQDFIKANIVLRDDKVMGIFYLWIKFKK